MANKFVFTPEAGLFLGKVKDNNQHKHYAIQITVALKGDVRLFCGSKEYLGQSLCIKSLVVHHLPVQQEDVLVILINPASPLGHYLNFHAFNGNVGVLPEALGQNLSDFAVSWKNTALLKDDVLALYEQATSTFIQTAQNCGHQLDDRILRALEILEKSPDKIYSLEEIAGSVYLSAGRFIHLFKQETGVTFRRMQLWIKLMTSFKRFRPKMTMTELALASGFADSAHYSRTFKQTFGIKPTDLLKDSQFVLSKG